MLDSELREMLATEPQSPEVYGAECLPENSEVWEEHANLYQDWQDRLIGFVKAKILESYRNGRAQHNSKNTHKKEKALK